MRVHVVVLNWNDAPTTRRCLASLGAVPSPPLVVHVVDNGSTDGSAERIAAEFPGARLHRLPENRGYAGGANAGIRAALDAGADLVFLLNNDCEVDPGAVAVLAEAALRRPECGLYTGKIYADRRRGVLWSCGVALGFWPNLCRLRGFGRRDRGQYDREETVATVTGCALLVARRVFETIGVFDDRYFVYVEDADFCARARRAGFSSLYVPAAVMEHAASASTGGGYSPVRKYLTAHGAVQYLRRHGTFVLWAGFLVIDVLGWPLTVVVGLLRGQVEGALAKGRGLLDGLLRRPADLSRVKRRAVLDRGASGP